MLLLQYQDLMFGISAFYLTYTCFASFWSYLKKKKLEKFWHDFGVTKIAKMLP